VSNEWLNKSRGGTDIGYQNSPVDVLYVDIEDEFMAKSADPRDGLFEREADGRTDQL